jgi:hypothetical protein
MASFTDSITQFNPYVSQLPVEAMVKVGMQKQAQYDQGVQKIQSQIDNVAGMDVAKDSDKQYLQSKLSQLGSKLTAVAAGDFSNQQLVSSVAGMATQVGRDEKVQNAVASTAWYKKQKQELDKQYKEGKSSVANVYDFTSQADKWLNNDEVGQRFNGRYSPYVDIDKKFLETFKALHSSETGKDFIYERYTDPITGKLLSTDKLAVAMEREGVEGIDAAKIQTALRATLTPDELNQMRINGNYQFKDATPDDLARSATTQYNSNVSRIDEQIERLQGIAALSDAQPQLQKRALDSIEQLKASKSTIAQNYISDLQLAQDDPERAKLNIYKEGAINQFANAFSWEKRTTEVLSNPQWEGQMQAEAASRDKTRLALAIRSQSFQEMDANRKFLLDEKKYDADNAALDPFLNSLGVNTKNLPSPLTALHQENEAAGTTIESDINTILANNPQLKGNRAELQKKLVEFQNGNYDALGGPMRKTAERIIENRKLIRENDFIEEKFRAEVEAENPALALRKKALEKELATMPGVTLYSNGNPTKYSARELYDLNSRINAYAMSTGIIQPGAGGEITSKNTYQSYLKANPNIPKKEVALINSMIAKGSNETAVNDRLRSFRSIYEKNNEFDKTFDQQIENKLIARTGKFTPTVEALDASKPLNRQKYENAVGNILLRYAPGYGGLAGGDQFLSNADAVTAQGWFTGEGKGDIQYKRVTQSGNDYILMMKGSESVMIKMTPEEAAQPALATSVDRFGQNILDKQKLYGGSTNATGNVEDAQFPRNSFKNTRKYAVVGDLKNDPTSPYENYINLKVKINGSWQPIQLDRNPMSAVEATGIINNMTDQDIERLLTKKGISFK